MSYELRCRDAGATPCSGHVRAEGDEEFKAKLLEHLRRKHGVEQANATVVDYLMSVATGQERTTRQEP